MGNKFDIVDGMTLGGEKLTVLAGPCVLETMETCLEIATKMKAICDKLGINYVFKASFDKANRTSVNSFRGPGLDEGLAMFKTIKNEIGCPIVTDIHLPAQAEKLASVVDILQIPAFLCRQTDLLLAAANTGKVINIKKGQFLAPQDMKKVLEKAYSTGNKNIALCERGTTFGYHNLVVDMRGVKIMRDFGCPIVFDATHSVQLPGGQGDKSGGQPEFIPVLVRAATAVGVDALFMEVHPNPKEAKSDGANSLHLNDVENLLSRVIKIREALRD